MKWIFAFIFVVFMPPTETVLFALPIGFDRTAGGLEYIEAKSKNFYIYADARTPLEAKFSLKTLEASRLIVEQWFGITRKKALPIIISAETDNASFANFITDVLEIQNLGQASRDLLWHEYVHATTYQHFNSILGPAGSVLNLPWLPSWWLEGLAEALSFSIGSVNTFSVEAYFARTKTWPSYARLHSLYADDGFSYDGYALSGAFVSYLLARLQNQQHLADIHRDFYYRSLPWWWPWSLVPGVNSLPFDVVLNHYFGKGGEELYEEYKKEAESYWNSQLLKNIQDFGFRNLDSSSQNPDSMKSTTKKIIKQKTIENFQMKKSFVFFESHDEQTIIAERPMPAKSYLHFGEKLYWIELDKNKQKFCYTDIKTKSQTKNVECLLEVSVGSLEIVLKPTANFPQIWLKSKKEQLIDSAETLHRFQISTTSENNIHLTLIGTSEIPAKMGSINRVVPISGENNPRYAVLVADSFSYQLVEWDNALKCSRMFMLPDYIWDIEALDNPNQLTLITRSQTGLTKYSGSISNLANIPCHDFGSHRSPILAAVENQVHNSEIMSLDEGISHSRPWMPSTRNSKEKPPKAQLSEQQINEFENQLNQQEGMTRDPSPAQKRFRPIAALPWIGNDTDGLNYGFLSIPLMDHLQNETLRLSMLYGLASRFPSIDLSLDSTSFMPTLTTSVSRSQVWNGSLGRENIYYDERAIQFKSLFSWKFKSLDLGLGIKEGYLIPLIGPTEIARGHYTELQTNISKNWSLTDSVSFGMEISSAVVPKSLSKDFDYNKLAIRTSLVKNFPWRKNKLSLDVESRRTRGRKTRNLKEVYRPLRIMVPGDGTGMNDLNFPIIGSGYLFGARFGDTTGITTLNWNVPIVQNIDHLLRIFYLDRLDWSQFISYGGAWDSSPFPSDLKKQLVLAHGYHLNLKIDLKGLRFSTGGGIGQVVGRAWDSYLSFSFDAIF